MSINNYFVLPTFRACWLLKDGGDGGQLPSLLPVSSFFM